MAQDLQDCYSHNNANNLLQGMEDMSIDREELYEVNEDSDYECDGEEENQLLERIGDFGHINFPTLSPNDVKNLHFGNLRAAYDFYNMFGQVHGFSIMKHKTGQNKKKEIVWKSFVCSRHG